MILNSVQRLLDAVGDLLTAMAGSTTDAFARRQVLAAVDVARYVARNADWGAALRAEDERDAAAILDLLRAAGWMPDHQPAGGGPGSCGPAAAAFESVACGLEWLAEQPAAEHEATRTSLIKLFRAQAERYSARSNVRMYSA
jgi:hypothetical protein